MCKEYRKLPWDSEGNYLEKSIKRDKAFELLQRRFEKGLDDYQNPDDNLTSTKIPINPKPPILSGGRKKLE